MRFALWCLPSVLVILPILAGALSENDAVDIVTGYDPGLCNKTNHGKLKLVKNREDEDSLFICSQVKGVFKWKSTDGSMTLGEFINPSYDCADILNKRFNAKDGFYWIHLNEATPKKVWCDMTTDGGGFILFGYQNSSVTWNVPSTNKPVDPFDSPRWSSVLGNTPILDIRVQVSSSAEFKDTKAHWSYRLNSKRPLKNLMLMAEKGCDANSPGIGDIAHVKDLMTEKIVTTNFRCAKFGVPYHAATKFGWASMNSCLQSPCRLGFAYIRDLPIQVDYFGAFSYSANGPVSGTAYNSTSFVGCDKGKCCACFGPYGGAKDYCSDECQAFNGGTVLKNVHVWFWVRTAIPKNVWKKCMEFQKQGDNDQPEWFKLINGNPTPVKGRCNQQTVLLNDGVAVVPSDKPLPDITGLLAFRKDTDRLYLRSRDAWRRVADQRKILQLENELRNARSAQAQEVSNLQRQINAKSNEIIDIESKFDRFNQTLDGKIRLVYSRDILASTVLKGQPGSFLNLLKQWFSFNTLICCWRTSLDGWDSRVFHARCDNRGKTITLVKVGNYIFGGYSTYQWGGSSDGYRSSSSNYIFSLRNKDNLSPFRSAVYRYSHLAIYTNPTYGPTFGGGHDLYISNNANKNRNSHAAIGYTYRAPSGYSNTRALLAGSANFTPNEVEVYYYV
ncbi:uncharacterized protein LOC114540704 [Dendronephthya gigantea]|uniref:uncharacterized protein LOC114540704 n=1 Tax=Dendronephthya gigantea TaxID=151771 RepID=UPI00106D7F0C|nr:uncharacterized protein LOC114540704 [Dendronephthya gigantea]